MMIIQSIPDMISLAGRWHKQGKSIGLVMTQGALHRGHASLIKAARDANDLVVVSVFVDPQRFSASEYERYPQDIDGDSRKAEALGADVVFAPAAAEMFPPEHITYVEPEGLGGRLRGADAPEYFRRVCTTALKLMNIVRPDRVYFGQKNAQKTDIIQRMVRDLDLSVEFNCLPVVREQDGLAMSAANTLLSEEERRQSLVLYNALCAAEELYRQGETSAAALKDAMSQELRKALLGNVDYVQLVDTQTLFPVERARKGVLVAVAVTFGQTRLSDNMIFSDMPGEDANTEVAK